MLQNELDDKKEDTSPETSKEKKELNPLELL